MEERKHSGKQRERNNIYLYIHLRGKKRFETQQESQIGVLQQSREWSFHLKHKTSTQKDVPIV